MQLVTLSGREEENNREKERERERERERGRERTDVEEEKEKKILVPYTFGFVNCFYCLRRQMTHPGNQARERERERGSGGEKEPLRYCC